MLNFAKMLCSLLVTVGVVSAARLDLDTKVEPKCPPCSLTPCPPLYTCSEPVVRDHCNCCDVCPRSEDLRPSKPSEQVQDTEESACEQVQCPKFKVCTENIQGLPLCTCPSTFICRTRKQRVMCGSDGKTYPSRCHMRVEACLTGKRIRVQRRRACQGNGQGDADDQTTLRSRRKKKGRDKHRLKRRKKWKRRQRKRTTGSNRRKRRDRVRRRRRPKKKDRDAVQSRDGGKSRAGTEMQNGNKARQGRRQRKAGERKL